MKKSLIIPLLISLCLQANAAENNAPSYLEKIGRACATFKANPLRTLGHAGLTVTRYGVCMSGGAVIGAFGGGFAGQAATMGHDNPGVFVIPIATAAFGAAFGTGMGILVAYKYKNIWAGTCRLVNKSSTAIVSAKTTVSAAATQAKTDFSHGFNQRK